MDPVTYILKRGASFKRDSLYVEDVFSIFGYSGIPSGQTINNGLDFVNNQGLLWTKNIQNLYELNVSGESHILIDTVRGNTQFLATDVNSGQLSLNSITGSPVTFTTSGYSLASGGLSRLNYWNGGIGSGNSYVSYAFEKASKFFDVVTYTGNGTTQVIPHSLNATPGFITVKNVGASGDWMCWHQGMVSGANRYLLLNTSGRTATGTGVWPWNNTLPTTTGFSVGFSGFTISGQSTNTSGNVYVAYVFADDAGGFGDSGNESIIKCGTYTGNGQQNFAVDVGWEPQFLMIKAIDVNSIVEGSSWVIYDNINGFSMNTTRVSNIAANTTGVSVIANPVYPVSSGFIIATTGVSVHASGALYGYVAIRRGLMKTPTDVTTVFDPELQASGTALVRKDFSCDVDMLLALPRTTTASGVNGLHSRLAGPGSPLATNSTAGTFDEILEYGLAVSAYNFRIKKGLLIGTDETQRIQRGSVISGWVHYAFTRARRFFDMASYRGDGTTPRTIVHNLGVKPELIISKTTSTAANWVVYASLLTAASGLLLNTSDPVLIGTPYWAGVEPTDTSFTVGSGFDVNSNTRTYINYLFASCPGLSQIGTYTGNATTNQIDCGFTNGAKFVLIKRFDAIGDWFVWDTARGIGTGNDPYSRLNQPSGETAGTDYIDPYASGFEISNTAPSGINASGGRYLFFAIA